MFSNLLGLQGRATKVFQARDFPQPPRVFDTFSRIFDDFGRPFEAFLRVFDGFSTIFEDFCQPLNYFCQFFIVFLAGQGKKGHKVISKMKSFLVRRWPHHQSGTGHSTYSTGADNPWDFLRFFDEFWWFSDNFLQFFVIFCDFLAAFWWFFMTFCNFLMGFWDFLAI